MKTGIWVAHGEGKFVLPMPLENYNVVAATAMPHIRAIPTARVALWQESARPTDVIWP